LVQVAKLFGVLERLGDCQLLIHGPIRVVGGNRLLV
jgi:hypothetical protein